MLLGIVEELSDRWRCESSHCIARVPKEAPTFSQDQTPSNAPKVYDQSQSPLKKQNKKSPHLTFVFSTYKKAIRRWRPRWPNGKISALDPEDSTEDPPCMGPVARLIIRSGQTSSRWCGVEVWRGGASSGVVFVI
ncbi:hypothetical protein AVEN_171600-1 [Araneus ventricosus]|uniref:Uncharacterized protein n=1 Tax=Araneus ventricosus TaxID=182803 RepID=A0A4Y2S249_ARAVE|nr:hypothetical protein AVEN_171600-1 [Araneus ventricosus]